METNNLRFRLKNDAGEDSWRRQIDTNTQEIKTINQAVAALSDPLEREVITIRYLDVDTCKPLPWRDVAFVLHGTDAQAKVLAVQRLHRKALQSLLQIMQQEISELGQNEPRP